MRKCETHFGTPCKTHKSFAYRWAVQKQQQTADDCSFREFRQDAKYANTFGFWLCVRGMCKCVMRSVCKDRGIGSTN